MKNLKIATWNIQNNKFDLSRDEKKIDSVINMLIFGILDVLVLQEVNPLLASKIEERLVGLKGEYKITTPVKKCINPINNLRVENNIIISKLNPVSVSVDTHLSSPKFSLENYNKRKLVSQMFEFNNEKIIINTTCLGNEKEIREKQFNEIMEEIDMQKLFVDDIILMGRLNSKLNDHDMCYLNKRLDDYGLKVLENYYGHKGKYIDYVDYIIIPKTWDIEFTGTYAGSIVSVENNFPVVASVTKKIGVR